MAETKTPKPTAAEKRKAADDALNARVKARQEAAAAKKDAKPLDAKAVIAKVNPLPAAEPTKAPAPWEQAVDKGAQQAAKVEEPKAKKERKPREPKPKTDATPSADLSEMLAKVRGKAVAVAEKAHNAEIKKLKAEFKTELKKQANDHKAILKGTVDKTYHDKEVRAAHEAGIKVGEKRAHAAIKAALKGGA